MKKFFTIIALAILILVSFVAIAVSFSDLSKNEEQNKALATQIKQNVELKEKLSNIEYIIEAYGKKTNELNKINERLGIEEARLQDEETELEKIKEERDKEGADIKKKEEKLEKEYKRLKEVDKSLNDAEKQLSADEMAWKKENENASDERDPNIPDTNGQPQGKSGGNTPPKKTEEDKQKELKALRTRRANLNIAKTKQENAWKTYQKDVKELENSKQQHEIKENNYNIRQKRYETDCLAFNQNNDTFEAEQSKHDGRSVEIQKLREKKAEIKQKISSFEKENPDIEAKYQELEKTKTYSIMIVAIFSFLVLALVIILIFMLVFRGENKRAKASNEVTKKVEPKLDTHGIDLNTSTGCIHKPNETENKLSRNNQNTLIDNISQINANLEKGLNQLKNENAYLKERLEKLESENAELKETLKETLKKLEENKLYGQTTTQHPKDKNTPPEDALIDEYSDSSEREKYKFEGKIYLNINKDYKQGRMENHDGINSIFSKSEFSTGSLFILIKNKLYFNFYRYNEDKPLPNSENESVIMGEIFDFKKDMYGRIKWCSPAIVEFENGNYVVKHKGSVCIEK